MPNLVIFVNEPAMRYFIFGLAYFRRSFSLLIKLIKTFTRMALAASTSLAASAQAQTPTNLNLDTWATRSTAVAGGVDAPVNWLTADDLYTNYMLN